MRIDRRFVSLAEIVGRLYHNLKQKYKKNFVNYELIISHSMVSFKSENREKLYGFVKLTVSFLKKIKIEANDTLIL